MKMTTRGTYPGRGGGDGVDEIARDLAAPLGEIVDALERVTLASVGTDDAEGVTPDLLWRARHLATELQQVIASLALATPPFDGRAPHVSVLVRHALACAADACAHHLDGRRVIVRCSPQLAVTTQPDRMHELLVALIDEVTRRDRPTNDLRLTAQRVGSRLVIEADGGSATGLGLERLHDLARAVGGRIEVVDGPRDRSTLRVHLPQQRNADLVELAPPPDDAA